MLLMRHLVMQHPTIYDGRHKHEWMKTAEYKASNLNLSL
ncbi:Uncharacterised protein [Vibrio cholerae]|uniref:Uncharacterized protein n=1 Tax=Vibrio cholerae TaxID=666 RepID=A0A656AWF4_VIBCL|nr:Uncharacterised protein [Vibrio cholerae]